MPDFFKDLPTPVKFFLSCLAGGLIFFGLFNEDGLVSILNGGGQGDLPIRVEVLVQTEHNQPIEGAEVKFIGKGSPITKYTTASGYAEAEIPFRGSVEINISKENYETLVEIIDLEADSATVRKFKLKSAKGSIGGSDLQIDYQYYTTRNEFIPLALSSFNPDLNIPIVQRILEDIGIDEIPLIAENSVFESIQNFKEESGNEKALWEAINNKYRFVSSDDNLEGESYELYVPEENSIEKVTSDGYLDEWSPDNTGECYFSYAPVLESLQSNRDNAKYTVFSATDEDSSITSDGIEYYSGTIIQYPKLLDLANRVDIGYSSCTQSQQGTSWIKKVISKNPYVRGFLGFSYGFVFDPKDEFKGCGSIWRLERLSPQPYVKFIDFVNNGQDPIRLEAIVYQSTNVDPYHLTAVDRRSSLFLPSSSSSTQNFNVSIKPNGHFLIPVEFGFSNEPVKDHYNYSYDMEKDFILNTQEIYVRKPLSNPEAELIMIGGTNLNEATLESVSLSQDFVEDTNSIEGLFDLIPKRLAIGSVLNVQSLRISNQDIDIDPPSDEPNIYISAYLQGGSCPYLMAFDPQQDIWLQLGTVLYARKDKSLQQEEFYNLRNSVSKVRLEERETEITYLDMLSVVYVDPETGETQEVTPPIAELQQADEEYLLLRQGEALEINLKDLIPPDSYDIRLKVNGYYNVL